MVRRGTQQNIPNRFEHLHFERVMPEVSPGDRSPDTDAMCDMQPAAETRVQTDHSQSVINAVDSSDLGFRWTLNPYRGCEHGCAYCYARPTHEWLGLSAGLDFETRIFAKPEAPRLLSEHLANPRWQPEPIVISGVTDPYQPVESKMAITRACLKVCAEARQPVVLVTKSRLILRDLDLLQTLAKHRAVKVAISVTSLDNELSAKLEPRAAAPRERLWVIQRLASAGIPVHVMVAPIIPALTDRQMPNILEAAAQRGAQSAAYVLLRLPHQLKQLFADWLEQHYPQRKDHVMNLLRQCHEGKLYHAEFGRRGRGTGAYAQQLAQSFALFRRRYHLDAQGPPLNSKAFRRPCHTEQLPLFAG